MIVHLINKIISTNGNLALWSCNVSRVRLRIQLTEMDHVINFINFNNKINMFLQKNPRHAKAKRKTLHRKFRQFIARISLKMHLIIHNQQNGNNSLQNIISLHFISFRFTNIISILNIVSNNKA